MKHFSIRIYGLIIDNGKVLVSDEFCGGRNVTKFPGGGLEFGEGPIDCVKREFIEEMNLEIEVIEHLHTTDFFIHSAFDPNRQVICIYYLVKPMNNINVRISEKEYDFETVTDGAQAFRWISLNEIQENSFTFETDKRASEILIKKN